MDVRTQNVEQSMVIEFVHICMLEQKRFNLLRAISPTITYRLTVRIKE